MQICAGENKLKSPIKQRVKDECLKQRTTY